MLKSGILARSHTANVEIVSERSGDDFHSRQARGHALEAGQVRLGKLGPGHNRHGDRVTTISAVASAITIARQGAPVLVIDTKWKRLKGAVDDPKYGVRQADVYQMMAYAHVYQCERLLLLYPYHAGLGSEGAGLTCVHRINGTNDSRIGVATLSLSNPKAAVGQLRGQC